MLNRKLKPYPNLANIFKVRKVWILDESMNKTGTIKDRKTKFVLEKIKPEKIQNLVTISSGNAIYSLSSLAPKGVKIYCVFDKHLDGHIKKMIKQWSYKTWELDLCEKRYSSEDFFQLFGLDLKHSVDCTNGCSEAYESLILDIKDIDPDFLIVPFGSGETFFGLIQGIRKYKLKSKLIGVTPFKKNKSLADKLSCFFSPYENSIKKVKNKRIKIFRVSEKAIQKAMAIGEKEMNCEASSAIVFAVLNKIKFPEEARVVFINTGRGKYLQ